jgi:hypothetical protein
MAAPTPRLTLTVDGDLDLSTGQLVIETDPVKNIVGKVRKALLLAQGEWFLAINQGVPWIQSILAVKNPNLRIVQNVLVDAILTVPEIASVQNVNLVFNRAARTCVFTAALITTVGAIPVTQPLAIP